MGGAVWKSSDYDSYATRTNYRTASRAEVFTSRQLRDEMNPAKIKLRESCNSDVNPNATPIILALDVTGSMGEYAELIAKQSLPELMGDIYETKPVSDPHLMFMGVDDVHCSKGGDLQVSQFEADIRILEQLRQIWMVCGGGGNSSESYDLPWYFAATKTKIDSFDKAGRKGFLFTMGDECAPYETNTKEQLTKVFGVGQHSDTTPAQCLAMAKEKYNVFHIVIEQGGFAQSQMRRVSSTWDEMMGTSVLYLKDFRDLSAVVCATMRIVNGEDMATVISESTVPAALRHAFKNSINAE